MSFKDIKALTKEEIQAMKLSHHDLWVVKIGDEIFGPYQTESLKEFVADNEDLFNDAFASRVENTDWQPFFSHALFQRRNPQMIKTSASAETVPIWVLDHGLKAGPFKLQEIDKKLKTGGMLLTDEISINDGMSWMKLYELPSFDRRIHSSSELPLPPMDTNFQKAKLELMEKIEKNAGKSTITDELAQIAHHNSLGAKIIPIKMDEIPLKKEPETTVSPKTKWLPTAVALMITVTGGIGYFVTSQEEGAKIANSEEVQSPKKGTPKMGSTLSATQIGLRNPASIPSPAVPAPQPRSLGPRHMSNSQYPTHIETHESPEPEPYVDNNYEAGSPPIEEAHSLIDQESIQENRPQDPPAESSGEPPAVEEVSDF